MTGKPRKVRNHGRWRWQVDSRDPLTGKRTRRFYETKAAADAAQTEVNAAPSEPLHPLCDPDVTVERYSEVWVARHQTAWRPRTLRSYRDLLRLHVLPFPLGGGRTLGTLRVADLHRGHVQALVEGKGSAGYAPDSIRLVFATFRAVCDAAVGDRLLRAHPADRELVKQLRHLWRRTDTEPKPFTVEQMQAFLAVARQRSAFADLYVIGFATGLRLGELTGLQLGDLPVSDGRRRLHVQRQLGQEASMLHPEPSATKTGKTRFVDASKTLVATWDRIASERNARAMARAWRPVPVWTFVTRNGTPCSQRDVQDDFKATVLGAKLPEHLTPHSMRHSFACLHIANGCNPKWLQQQMGHSSIKVTLDYYAKWWNLEDHAAADALGALVGSEMAANAL